jgi:4a-hydroxytetrahydrobiopterin dehydratase
MMACMATLTGRDIAAAALQDWSYLHSALHTRLLTKDFETGLRLIGRIGAAAEAANHHPDLDLRYTHVDVRLSSHDEQGVTNRDIALARAISDIAATDNVAAEPHVTKVVEIALDTPDAAAVRPFWRAVLDMDEVDVEGYDPELRDETLPNMWFQHSGRQEPRQRFHFDLWVAPEVVDARIAAAVEAGGTLVSDAEAPSFWVLADSEGNKVCLCTWLDRDPT